MPGIGKGLQPWVRAGHVTPRFWVAIYKRKNTTCVK